MAGKLRLAFLLLTSCFLYLSCFSGLKQVADGVKLDPEAQPFERLSDYAFFTGEMQALKGNEGVTPYDLIAPLFSDYAAKARFVWLPDGTSATYNEQEVFDFPIGSVLIKNFYYEQEPNSQKHIIETRLLVNRKTGWDALPYIWNEEQNEAYLEIAGGSKEVTFTGPDGQQHIEYLIPNKNQCKGCHEFNQKLSPIGPKARNLNQGSQLKNWEQIGYLSGLPETGPAFSMVDYRDKTAELDQRAKAYLEMNCGHCHRKEGPAKTSGLHLISTENKQSDWGIFKSPVAAGKGSGGHSFDIVPGHAEQSIMLYRMEATDPAIRMPEVGRQMVDEAGVALIRDWINAMPSNLP